MKLTIFFRLFLIFLLILIILDIAMIVSLIKTGDERKQLIVWKASSFTLLTVVLGLVLDIVESIVKGEAMTINPFIKLSVTATIYLTAFRIWANRVLKEYIIKGYVMDDARLREPERFFGKDYFEEQLERIRDIRSGERRFTGGSRTFIMLLPIVRLQKSSMNEPTVQNKIWA